MRVDDRFEEWARARTLSLLRQAFLLTGSQSAAEDLVQTTLEKVALAWSRIDGHPDAYARRAMYRVQIRWWQRRARERQAGPLLAGAAHVEDQTGRVEMRMVIERALRQITPMQRAVLVLRFYEDLSEADTASTLRCSVGTVKSQTHKALRALRQAAPDLAELVGRSVVCDD